MTMGFDRGYPPEHWTTQEPTELGLSRSQSWDYIKRCAELKQAQEASELDAQRLERAKRAMAHLTEDANG